MIVDINGWCAQSDSAAPQLAGFDFTPKSISTASGPQTITITAHVTDDMTGVAAGGNLGIEVRFRSASGQFTGATAYSGPTSGTLLDGVYVMQATVPVLAESGPWTVEFVYFRDGVGNTRYLNANDLAAAGFPTSFTQTADGDHVAPQLAGFDFTPKSISTASGPQTITITATSPTT